MQQFSDITITIFTPTYNRAKFLPKLFSSISQQVQPGTGAEWLVIDDGSTDNTSQVLEELRKERPDLVRYVRFVNGGKHRAINRAAKLARGRWIMIIDSDDLLSDGAFASVTKHTLAVEENERIGILRALKQFPELAVEHRFKVPENPCTHADWLAAQAAFDSAEVIRTSVLARYPFPEFEGERFMAEGWLWHSIEKTHLTQYVNKHWIVCFYQEEGLSASSQRIRANSPRSTRAVYAAMLGSPLPWHLYIKAVINWWRYHFHATAQGDSKVGWSWLSLWAAVPGWIIYLRDKDALK